jgi:hypothetical protein
MVDLADLQARFFARITGGIVDAALTAEVVGDGRLDGEGRLFVYADMYRSRLLEALEASFPLLARALGDRFATVCDAYLRAFPSRSPSLRFLGRRLPAFLQAARVDPPWCAALARLEWSRLDVFDAADEPLLTRPALSALPPAEMVGFPLKLVQAHRRVTLGWRIDEASRVLLEGGVPSVVRCSTPLLIWRRGVQVLHRRLDRVERRLLRVAERRPSVARFCEHAAELVGEAQAAGAVFHFLARWADDQLLAR